MEHRKANLGCVTKSWVDHEKGTLWSTQVELKGRCMQELRPYLHSHRAWLSGLWAASGGGASLEGRKEQALLLSQLLGSLLKICDPEVLQYCSLNFCTSAMTDSPAAAVTCATTCCPVKGSLVSVCTLKLHVCRAEDQAIRMVVTVICNT